MVVCQDGASVPDRGSRRDFPDAEKSVNDPGKCMSSDTAAVLFLLKILRFRSMNLIRKLFERPGRGGNFYGNGSDFFWEKDERSLSLLTRSDFDRKTACLGGFFAFKT